MTPGMKINAAAILLTLLTALITGFGVVQAAGEDDLARAQAAYAQGGVCQRPGRGAG